MPPGGTAKKPIFIGLTTFIPPTSWTASSFTREGTGDGRFDQNMMSGYEFWKKTFFLEDGTPRYYDHKTLPLDIQCCSQAIDTLVFFHDRDPESLPLALKVARWTIENMQDRSGYFYYRRYSPWLVNKTPTLHWGQATMMCALAGLYTIAVSYASIPWHRKSSDHRRESAGAF